MSMAAHPNIPTVTSELEPVRGEKLIRPFTRFAQLSSSGGLVLLACTLVAMIWANSAEWESYHHIFQVMEVHLGVGDFMLQHHGHMTVGLFINDALMAIFFLLVGLEIKREIIVGELSDIKRASLPIVAAFGGMIAPAIIFTLFNFGHDSIRGWGVPMATDIAFALGILALLGDRIPNSLKVFLASLAIADDLGALLVIAFFYTEHLNIEALGFAAAIVGLLILLNRSGFKSAAWFLIPGIFLWYFVFTSGVHATIAGVLLAATIPVNPRVEVSRYSRYTRAALDIFDESDDPTQDIRTNSTQRAAVMQINENGRLVLPLLHRLEHALEGPVAFLIIPIFALANAGLHITGGIGEALFNRVSIGVILGLVIGKPLGITLACYIAVKLNIGALSKGVTWKQMIGVACLGGIGFTMALFIATLGFKPHPDYLDHAKLGILTASAISAILGLVILLRCKPNPIDEDEQLLEPDAG